MLKYPIRKVSDTSHKKEGENDDFNSEKILKLDLDELETVIRTEDSTRKYLAKIAVIRFGMTKGEISRIHSKQQLAEQLAILINNEKTHQSIKRLASSEKNFP